MSLNAQKRSTFTNHILAYLESTFLDQLLAELFLTKFGVKRSLAKRSGTTIKYNRYVPLTGTTTALTEGVSPNGLNRTDTQVTLSLAQYGQFIAITDEFQLVSITDEAEEMAKDLAYDAAISMDTISGNALIADGTQTYADAANNLSKANVESGADKMRSDELRIALKNFKVANVPPYEDGYYKGIINPLMEFDLMSESAANTFVILSSYTTNDVQERGKIGRAYGINLYTSTNIRADGTSTHTYGNIFLGRKSYVVGDIETGGLKMIHKGLGSAGTEDPIDQRQTLGWKAWFGVKVLEALRVQILWAYNAG